MKRNNVITAKLKKKMVGTWGLEPHLYRVKVQLSNTSNDFHVRWETAKPL